MYNVQVPHTPCMCFVSWKAFQLDKFINLCKYVRLRHSSSNISQILESISSQDCRTIFTLKRVLRNLKDVNYQANLGACRIANLKYYLTMMRRESWEFKRCGRAINRTPRRITKWIVDVWISKHTEQDTYKVISIIFKLNSRHTRHSIANCWRFYFVRLFVVVFGREMLIRFQRDCFVKMLIRSCW